MTVYDTRETSILSNKYNREMMIPCPKTYFFAYWVIHDLFLCQWARLIKSFHTSQKLVNSVTFLI